MFSQNDIDQSPDQQDASPFFQWNTPQFDVNNVMLVQHQRIQQLEDTLRQQNQVQQNILQQIEELKHKVEAKDDNTSSRVKRLRVQIPNSEAWSQNAITRRKAVMSERRNRKLQQMRQDFETKAINKNLPELLDESRIFKTMPEAKLNAHSTTASQSGTIPAVSYDQITILKKINLFAESINVDKIPETGHCHGFNMLWLYMRRRGLQNVFYAMIKQIAECPESDLWKIHDVITTFYKLIELGQNPRKYLGKQFSQRDMDKILGVGEKDSLESDYSENELGDALANFVGATDMINITGWGYKTNELTGHKEFSGHSVGVVYVDGAYRLRDANYKFLGEMSCTRVDTLAANVFNCIFTDCGMDSQHKYLFNIEKVDDDLINPGLLAKLSMFSKSYAVDVVNQTCEIEDEVNRIWDEVVVPSMT